MCSFYTLLLSFNTVYAANTFTVSSLNASSGESVTVDVDLANDDPVQIMQFDLLYPDDALEFVSCQQETYGIPLETFTCQPQSSGEILVIMMTSDLFTNPQTITSGSGTIVSFDFEVSYDAQSGPHDLSLADVVLSGAYSSVGYQEFEFTTNSGILTISEPDIDGDGFVAPADCDDGNPQINPEVEEIWYDGIDSNCDGRDDYDQDADGFIAAIYAGLATDGVDGTGMLDDGDCNDQDPSSYPNAADEWYDGVDSDCDGRDDYDQDEDGYVSQEHLGLETENIENSGSLPAGDCADLDPDRNPGAEEIPDDGIDQDCDGLDSTSDFLDTDQDGEDNDLAEDVVGKETGCSHGLWQFRGQWNWLGFLYLGLLWFRRR